MLTAHLFGRRGTPGYVPKPGDFDIRIRCAPENSYGKLQISSLHFKPLTHVRTDLLSILQGDRAAGDIPLELAQQALQAAQGHLEVIQRDGRTITVLSLPLAS